jgi:hypothetical protein
MVLLTLAGCAGPTLAPSHETVRAVAPTETALGAGPALGAGLPTPPPDPGNIITAPPTEQREDRPADAAPDRWSVTWDRLGRDIDLSVQDYQNYYTGGNLAALGIGIGAVAPLANTTADEHIRHWYQHHVRGETTDEFSQVFEYAGQLWLVLPLCVEGAGLLGHGDDHYAFDEGLAEWSNRSLRAVCVGTPPMVALYVILGASRPDRNDSAWHPFNDIHGVSGHTFFGAVGLLTAAEMTDDEVLKSALVAGSFLTGWARINDDKHYFSQVALGWWMAYLAVRRVNDTQEAVRKQIELLPFCAEGPGIGVQVRY